MRKRQFDVTKFHKLYRNYADLFNYLNGESIEKPDFGDFESKEIFENKDKVTEMFCKKRRNIPIPDIDINKPKSIDSVNIESANTELTLNLMRNKQENLPPVEFNFKPMKPQPSNYIVYKPKVPSVNIEQEFAKIDYMITQSDWEDISARFRTLTEGMRDLSEEIIDRLEKFTAKGDIPSIERCMSIISRTQLKTSPIFPTRNEFEIIYSAWVHLRKKHGNALMRKYHTKAEYNEAE